MAVSYCTQPPIHSVPNTAMSGQHTGQPMIPNTAMSGQLPPNSQYPQYGAPVVMPGNNQYAAAVQPGDVRVHEATPLPAVATPSNLGQGADTKYTSQYLLVDAGS